MTQTSMLHVRVDAKLKEDAGEKLAGVGLTISDAVRNLADTDFEGRRITRGLTTDADAHDAWFRAKVREALEDKRPAVPHRDVMTDTQALIDGKRRARS